MKRSVIIPTEKRRNSININPYHILKYNVRLIVNYSCLYISISFKRQGNKTWKDISFSEVISEAQV